MVLSNCLAGGRLLPVLQWRLEDLAILRQLTASYQWLLSTICKSATHNMRYIDAKSDWVHLVRHSIPFHCEVCFSSWLCLVITNVCFVYTYVSRLSMNKSSGLHLLCSSLCTYYVCSMYNAYIPCGMHLTAVHRRTCLFCTALCPQLSVGPMLYVPTARQT